MGAENGLAGSTVEGARLAAIRRGVHWRRWGPYLSERQWGTVREDYSSNGDAWNYLPHDHARSRAYRWGEDGIAGFSDDQLLLCLGLALWNGKDPILKERLFGLTNLAGQSRRRRQGAVLLSRRHADALLHADALQISAGRFSLRATGRGKSSAWPRPAGIRADRHRDIRRESLLRCRDRIRQGRSRRHSDADNGSQPCWRRRHRCTCCRNCGLAISGRGGPIQCGRGFWREATTEFPWITH